MRRFEFNDSSSHKFWQIEVQASSHTVCYGKVGTKGRAQTKTFDSEEKAGASAEKLIQQKVKKGYAPVSVGTRPVLT